MTRRCQHGGRECPRIHRQAEPRETEERWSLWAALPMVAMAAVAVWLWFVAVAALS